MHCAAKLSAQCNVLSSVPQRVVRLGTSATPSEWRWTSHNVLSGTVRDVYTTWNVFQTMSESTTTLGRPFTAHSFQKSVQKFDELVDEITLKNDTTAGPDERRRFIAG